ncbi:MAG: PAS domain S-box protein, partial [Nitrospinae bacterium]|nr:PAS domain S-box protein [Nitrospinota bacterium]
FESDRAFLLHPLDKAAKTYTIPFEQTKPEYPGAFTANKELPVTKEVAEIFKTVLEASAPVSMNLVEGITDEAQLKEFDIKTQLVVSLYPKTGKPWKLGMHQCSRVREWTKEERELFHAISLVISDKLSNLLLVRNLGESEERHRILFNNASVGIGISSEGGDIVDANETLLEMMGYSRRELIGMRFNDMFAVQEDKGSLSGRLSKEGAVHDFEAKLRKKDGSEFIANLTVTRYNLGGKQVTQAMILDITERKKAETELRESEASIRALVEHSPIAIIIDVGVEADEKIIMMNQKFTDMFGYTIADVPDVRHWWPLAYPDEKYREELRIEWLARVKKALHNHGEIKPMEATVVCKDGSNRYVRIGLASIGSINIVTFEDLTERKRNEAVNASRLHLLQFSATHTLDELLEETLNETEKLTGSSIGFYHFVDDDQSSLTLQAWSTRTKAQFYKAEGKGLHYAISEAGVWVDCVYQHKPVIHNDYASLPSRKGMPEGHAEVVRELVVPVYRGGKVKAILGVGNRPSDYTEHDTEIVSLLADLAWEIAERKRAEDVKQEAVNRLQKIASRVPGVVYQFRLRPDGGFCFPYASDALRDICRVNPEEVLEDASKAFAAVHPDDFPPLMAAVQASAKDLTLWQEEFRVKFDDGVVRHLLGNAIPEREAGGSTLWHGVITDITERKLAEEKLRESGEILERIFETTHVHIVLLDSKFNFIRVNKAYADVCGFPPDYFIGKNHFDFYPSEELESKFRRVVQTGEPYTVYSRPFEFPDQPQLGITYWDLAVYPVKKASGEVEGLLFTLLEVTERVRAEKALIAAKEQAERANKAKSVFLSSMSHEIRTPLTSVIGFSQLLATDAEHPLSEFQRQLLGKVMVSGDQLLELINSALDLARIESGDIEVSIEPVDMKSVAMLALTSSAHLARECGVRLASKAPSVDCCVMADSILLRQVLTNLLSNAIKFNRKDGETILSWSPLGENKVRISVSDEGFGISVDKIKDLYKPFDRLGMEGQKIKGFGVGLAIVKRLVDSMGGVVGVKSEVGKGSTFFIDLPAGKNP